jgi:hypothetical protein
MKQPHYCWAAIISVGDNIIVTPGSNPTTGFKRSEIVQIQNQDILKQIGHKTINPEQTGIVGAAGKRYGHSKR